MENNILDILNKLIACKSITPFSDGSIEYISTLLEKNGFHCDIQKLGPKSEQVTNLYAIYGNEPPNICFAGHVDVVPIVDRSLWKFDPFLMTISENKIYGRGVVDMKGAIACAIAAVLKLISTTKKNNGSISFLLTSDEEGTGEFGTKKMLEYISNSYPKINFCILGEPTSSNLVGDTIKIGRRGSINFELLIHGKAGHVAYPDECVNPIKILSAIMNDLINMDLDIGSEFFQKSNLEFTEINSSNKAKNIIPEQISASFNIRFNNLWTVEKLVNNVENVIKKHSTNYKLSYQSSSNSFLQTKFSYIKKFSNIIEKITKIKPNLSTSGGTSDARFIHQYAETAECGLKYRSAHKINEFTTLSDLNLLYNIYHSSFINFLG